jgi:hypothetical protein
MFWPFLDQFKKYLDQIHSVILGTFDPLAYKIPSLSTIQVGIENIRECILF